MESLTIDGLARQIDSAVLAPNHTAEDVELACHEAVAYGFAAVKVAPCDVAMAALWLAGSDVRVGGTVGFPLGHSGLEAKRAEARTCLAAGADELDIVINLMAARSHLWDDVQDEIATIRRVAEGKILTVTLECCYLSPAEKIQASELAAGAGADIVRTSTGFGRTGATVEDVTLLSHTVGDVAGIEAAGGIRSFENCLAMIRAGATRIGTSTGAAIIHDFQEARAAYNHA
jgi:deoxyribose-phosphate aldolase